MNSEAAAILSEYGDVEQRDDYSGRGMDGRETSAVVGTHRELMGAVAEVMEHADEEQRHEVARALRLLRSDSMGTEIIWY